METRTYTIWPEARSELAARIAKLNERAERKGLGGGHQILDVEPTEIVLPFVNDLGDLLYTITEPALRVTVAYDPPVLPGGWHIKGLVTAEEGGAVTTRGDLDPAWRERAGECDHCGTRRSRRHGFVLSAAEDGREVIVGSTCLIDHLGHKVPVGGLIARMSDPFGEFDEDFGDEGRGRRIRPTWSPRTVALVAGTIIRAYGYVSVAKAEETGAESTSSLVKEALADLRKFAEIMPSDGVERGESPWVTPEEAEALLAWLPDHVDLRSEYGANLAALAVADGVEYRSVGILASGWTVLARAIERAEREAAERAAAEGGPVSQPVGNLGERISFRAEIINFRDIESDFGISRLVKMRDGDGNVLTTFTTGAWAWDWHGGVRVGATISAKGTVKRHSEWNGRVETQLGRVASVKVLEEAR